QGGTFVLEISARWCHPCRVMEKFLVPMSDEFSDIPFYNVDYDSNTDIFDLLEIGTVPYIVIFQRGKPEVKIKGLISESSLREAIAGIS
ncbi:MAG: thioredoxin family protein, partial [Candidatus Thermoplasmatota archaeon]|nr:thioredoxin family protein [Candidatus Thermoplasmatota archaeon]